MRDSLKIHRTFDCLCLNYRPIIVQKAFAYVDNRRSFEPSLSLSTMARLRFCPKELGNWRASLDWSILFTQSIDFM